MRKSITLLLAVLLFFTADAATRQRKHKALDKAKVVLPVSVRSLHKASRRVDEPQTIDIYITGNYTFYFDVDEDEGTSDWFFSATDDSGCYTVRLDYPTDEAGKYGTYTYKDLDRDYSYIKDYSSDEMEYRNYVEGTTFTVSDNHGRLHIEGTLVCDNGVTYNLHFEHTPQTFDVEGTELLDIYYFTEDNDWYMRFQNDHFRVSLDFVTGSQSRFDGTYTEQDAIADYCFVSDMQTESTDYLSTMNVTLTMPEGVSDPTVACEITGTAVSEHGDTYRFHMKKNPPIVPVRSVDIGVDLNVAEWPSKRDGCEAYFELSEKDNPARKWQLALDALIGNLTEADLIDTLSYLIDTATGTQQQVDNGIITLRLDSATLALQVKAALVMPDSIEYCFSFSHPIATRGERSLSFSNLSFNNTYYSDLGIQWLDASNSEATIEVTLTGADVPGTYDNATAAIEMAVRDEDGETSAVSCLAIIHASTTLDEHNQPVLSAFFLGSDKRVYALDAHLDIPAIADTLDFTFAELKARDLISTMGAFQIYGYNSDSTLYVALAPEAAQFAGHYTTESLTLYNNYSFLAFLQEDGSYKRYPFYTADFDVIQEDDVVTLEGSFQVDNHLVHLLLQGKVRPNGIDYDSEDDDLDVAFAASDLVSLEKDVLRGYAYIELQNEQRGDVFAMLFYLNSFDADIVIPEGVYDVNESYQAPSVQAGSFYNNTIYSTFYGFLSSEGYLSTPLWFLTQGTVVVKKTSDGCMQLEVNGQNSYNRGFHVTYSGSTTAIHHITAPDASHVTKVLEDGQVVIRKAGRKYSLSGQMLE